MQRKQTLLLATILIVVASAFSLQVHQQPQHHDATINHEDARPTPMSAEERTIELLFEQHCFKYRRFFKNPTEKAKRYENFKTNYLYIKQHQEASGYSLALNQFADLTAEEFNERVVRNKGVRQAMNDNLSASGAQKGRGGCQVGKRPPRTLDYRGKITPVVDQGVFGNSAIFSSIEAISDGIQIRSGKKPPTLSIQNLVDCVGDAAPADYFQWIINHGGIDTEAAYPPTPSNGTCRFNPNGLGAKISWYYTIPSGNETDLACSLAFTGPTTVCVDASHSSFQFYSSGVYYEPSCSTQMIDHCMVVVGYGSLNNQDYWIVQNSWGASWGQNGFILMSRNRNNNCGIASAATVPFSVPASV